MEMHWSRIVQHLYQLYHFYQFPLLVGSGVQLDSKSIQSTHSRDHMLLGLDSNILLDKDPSLVYPEELIRYFIMSSAVT